MIAAPIPIIAFDEIDSTNAEARRRADAGEIGPVWFTAAHQTAGRGRRGRAWDTSVGNLAATCLFVTVKPPGEAAQVSFVAALAVADLADVFVDPALVSLKWPNDTLIDGKKTAGILVESGSSPSGGLWVAVGIGVNLAHAPQGLAGTIVEPTFLGAHGRTPTPSEALAVLSAAFADRKCVWETVGFGAIAQAWTRKAHGLGGRCVARLPNETVEGVAEGLDADGALRLRTPDGAVRRITAGDVFF